MDIRNITRQALEHQGFKTEVSGQRLRLWKEQEPDKFAVINFKDYGPSKLIGYGAGYVEQPSFFLTCRFVTNKSELCGLIAAVIASFDEVGMVED